MKTKTNSIKELLYETSFETALLREAHLIKQCSYTKKGFPENFLHCKLHLTTE